MNYRILLVDDEPEIIDINQRYLKQAGYEVEIAHNGVEALHQVKISSFHMIITDIMMPQMDGYDLISEVLVLHPDQPFLFITAKISEPDKIYSLSLGADDFISKPFSPRELVLRVNNILKRIYGQQESQDALTVGDLTMNYARRGQVIKIVCFQRLSFMKKSGKPTIWMIPIRSMFTFILCEMIWQNLVQTRRRPLRLSGD